MDAIHTAQWGNSKNCADGGRWRTVPGRGLHGDHLRRVVITPDVTAPVITKITATPNQLWPPNRQMTAVTIDVSLTGGCAGTCRITGVTSSDPTKGRGTGKNGGEEPDWVVTGPLTLRLRAERSGNVALRAYTVAITCVDSAGNTTTGNVVVAVPHDQRPSNRQQR
jgi:hypothetical protein